jgi:hypothetical protein
LLGPEATSRHGRARLHRLLGTAAATAALALPALAPAVATAGSLLSGYGGPGEGNQAILGAALLNGRSGGSGSSGGGSTGGGSTGGGSAGSGSSSEGGGGEGPAVGRRTKSLAGARGARGAAGGGVGGRGAKGTAGEASGGASRTYINPFGAVASRGGDEGSQTLGLSGTDFVYVLLALGAVGLTGVLTRRLTQHPG